MNRCPIPLLAFSLPLCLGLFAAGCTSDRGGDSPFGSGDGGTAGGDTDGTTAAETVTAGSASKGAPSTTDATGGVLFDVGGVSATAEGGGPGMGCNKVDFLFVIDASESMTEEQENIVTSIPGFVDAIQSQVDVGDIHMLVTDVDNVWSTATCGSGSSCDAVCSYSPGSACRMGDVEISCTPPPDSCDETRGAGRNADLNLQPCGTPGNERYIDLLQEPDLPGRFGCIATVGPYGGCIERPMASMVAAVSEPLLTGGGCNEGFLRPDAILVVVVLTDASDQSPGSAAEWHDALVQAKLGNEEAIVVLGIYGDTGQPGAVCGAGQADWAPDIDAFVKSWGDRGHSASVCEPDYAPFFASAIESIDLTCDIFEPPG